MTSLVRELRFNCEDDLNCGHTFVAELAITRTVRPSLRPNPDVFLPMNPRRPTPQPANDDVPIAEATSMTATG